MKGYFLFYFLALAVSVNCNMIEDWMSSPPWSQSPQKDMIAEDELRAPVVEEGQRSPEEVAEAYQGDIILMDGRNGVIDTNKRWPAKTIPYIIEPRYNSTERNLILGAMREIMQKTCIRFVQRTNQKDYIYVLSQRDKGCSSLIGRAGIGRQNVNVESLQDNPRFNCMNVGTGTIVHEFIHAIGFYHMQSAYDRDNYVIINKDNINQRYISNFDKETSSVVSYFGTSYDYPSIMHYGKKAFSVNNRDTITTKDRSKQDVIGQRTQMSTGDIARIRNMYKC